MPLGIPKAAFKIGQKVRIRDTADLIDDVRGKVGIITSSTANWGIKPGDSTYSTFVRKQEHMYWIEVEEYGETALWERYLTAIGQPHPGVAWSQEKI